MAERILVLISIICSFSLNAQTGIGTTTPNASAKLDVYSDNKGFLPPRVSLTDAYDRTTISSPAIGLLVYCKGDAGLAAGYYYWNGNAWATIATDGGSGSIAAEYGSQILSSNVTISNSTPVDVLSFTLPSAGTWELITFFRAQGTSGNTFAGVFAIYDANNDLVSNSEILSAYGEIASTGTGVVRVTTTGVATYKLKAWVSSGTSFEAAASANGRTGVTWKKISGNAPVTGQSVDYGIARYTGADGSGLSTGALVSFDANAAGNLVWSGNKFTLKANKTYELEASLAIYHSSVGVAGVFQIYDYTNSKELANSLFMSQNGGGSKNQNANTPIKCIVTPITDIQVGVKLNNYYGGAPSIIGNGVATGSNSAANASYFIAKQLGSSAIVNPWVLSGNDVYNTTGKVGIGNASPATSAILDLTSTSKGILIPRMTGVQKNAITSPSNGLLIYQTDAPIGFYYYNGSSWLNIANVGTNNRYISYSNQFVQYSSAQSLTSLSAGVYTNLTGSDLEVIVPSGFSSNKIIIKWDTWGDLNTTNAAHGSLRYQIVQSGSTSNTYGSVSMNGWATIATGAMRFATPITYIITDLSPGTYTFKLQILREAEVGTVSSMNNYYVSGSAQVYVK